MTTALAILGALGGFSAFVTSVVLILRAIFKQVTATDSNTNATQALTKSVDELKVNISHLDTRVTILEDHDQDRRNGVRIHP